MVADYGKQPGNAKPDAEWMERVASGAGVIFYTLRVQPDVAFEFLGSAFQSLLGLPVTADTDIDTEAVLGRIDPDHAEQLAASLDIAPGMGVVVDLKWRHVAGHALYSRTWVQAHQRPDGSVVHEGIVQNVTELRDAEEQLRRSEERNRLLAENAYDVIWTMGLDRSVTYINSAVERVRGFTPEEALRQSPEEIQPPESAAVGAAYYRRLFAAIEAGTEPPIFHGEQEYYRKDGSIMTGDLQVIPHIDADGNVVELLGVTRDISERKRLEAELTRLASTDPVTGVWNRRRCTELIADDIAQVGRRGHALSLLMLDVDYFKSVNDTYGHLAGDAVLIEIGRRLLGGVRSTDVVARWGGEEFVVLLRDCDLAAAVTTAEKLRQSIAGTPFADVGTISVSVGAAQLQVCEELDDLLRRADAALYRAKESGRNTVAAL
jgi:diguanylate cyclase (GGDEF)-like protein/PAS domain S-box-containing protein